MKIAVFLPNWIGDTVMATPALRAVRRHYADAEIVGILRPYVRDVLAGLDLLDRTIVHIPRGRDPEHRGWAFVRKLRRERFDTALLLPNSLRSAWLARASGAKRRIGFQRDARGWLLTDRLRPRSRRVPNPVIDEYLRLAAALGCTRLDRTMELAVTPDERRQFAQFWSEQPDQLQDREIVCLNPGGAYGAAKHWPTESFAALARRIAVEWDRAVLVVCGPNERDEARAIVRGAAHRNVTSLAEARCTLGLTKAAVKASRLLITTDSGPRHFAPPLSVPVVTLFGPTHVAWSETFVTDAVHLQLELECGPCQKRVCPLKHHRCMRDLTVDRVFTAAQALLERTPGRGSAA